MVALQKGFLFKRTPGLTKTCRSHDSKMYIHSVEYTFGTMLPTLSRNIIFKKKIQEMLYEPW